jgi:glycosyltransferase involved in cell wall biosynthesis
MRVLSHPRTDLGRRERCVVVNPLISVVMPVFNCEATLAIATRSILGQSCADFELLILDDGSTDKTVQVAHAFVDSRVRVIADSSGNRGLASRLNEGVDLARGRYIARMDGDDISFPLRLQRQVEFLESNPEIDLVGCSMVIFKGAGELVGLQPARTRHDEICGNFLRSCLLPHATWMGRTNWFRTYRYDPSHHRAEDRELLLRTRNCSQFAGIPEAMYAYRVNGVSVRKNAIARYEYLRSVLADARSRKEWFRFLGAGAAELAKLAIDSAAIATHSDRFWLRHRARTLCDPHMIGLWRGVWSSLQGPVTVVC